MTAGLALNIQNRFAGSNSPFPKMTCRFWGGHGGVQVALVAEGPQRPVEGLDIVLDLGQPLPDQDRLVEQVRPLPQKAGNRVVAGLGHARKLAFPARRWEVTFRCACYLIPWKWLGARHVGLGPGLVDEDKPRGIDPALISAPLGAAAPYVGAVLLTRDQRLFLT